MGNPFAGMIAGYVAGLMAGVTGYAIDIAAGAIFQALMPTLAFTYGLVSFLMAVAEAHVAGIFFTSGVLSAGLLLGDAVTAIAGALSIVGFVVGLLLKGNGGR